MVDIPYRYNVSPARSGKCNVFKPTALQEDQVLRTGGGSNLRMPASHAVDEPEDWDRYANFGANWMGNMNKIPRNKHCSVIWEVT